MIIETNYYVQFMDNGKLVTANNIYKDKFTAVDAVNQSSPNIKLSARVVRLIKRTEEIREIVWPEALEVYK